MNAPRKLFVCGCPRSGTSGIAVWLSQSPAIAIGMERYQTHWRNHLSLPADAFTEARFFDVREGDTWYASLDRFPEHYARLRSRWPQARYVGDKVPGFWRNLRGLLQPYPRAKIIWTHRDPFAVARSYKTRSRDPADATWGRHRDATFAVLEWNESIGKIVEFFNADLGSGRSAFEHCFVLEYAKFITNSVDQRALAEFLAVRDPFPVVSVLSPRKAERQVELSESEKDLIWSLLDPALVAEMQKIVGRQFLELGRAAAQSNRTGRREWYHTKDRQVAGVEYGELTIPGCSYVFRGRAKPLDLSASYVACVGSATTFGRFLRRPYPTQLEEASGVQFINLGIGGGRPESFCTNRAVMDVLRNAQLVVIDLMSARGYPSCLFAPMNHEANMGRFMDCFGWHEFRGRDAKLDWLLSTAEKGQPMFVDRIYEIGFKYLSADQRDQVRDTLLSQYLRDVIVLAKEIGRPVVALLMTRAPAFEARGERKPGDFAEWSGGYPHFIDGLAVQYLRQRGIPVIESRSQRGFPFAVRHWENGEPVSAFPWQQDPSLNTYYPSQEMHDDAARLLLDSQPLKALGNVRG